LAYFFTFVTAVGHRAQKSGIFGILKGLCKNGQKKCPKMKTLLSIPKKYCIFAFKNLSSKEFTMNPYVFLPYMD